ncbi:hypothetical protein AAZX31_14G114900 [Glycine max]|uniref:Complex III subunit VII n=1 Tax=Glycine soja TaxID=3848 RepID=A0A445H524_GLYSO|nr:Cytochrome b-c1 complex subunit 7-2 isoform B [Glycine soja]
MASFLQWFLDPKKNWFAAQHMKSLSRRLRKYGLRYDDLYDPYYDLDVKEALNRLPKEVVDARHARLKRAIDLSMKHEYLPDNLQVFFFFLFSYFLISIVVVIIAGIGFSLRKMSENGNTFCVGMLRYDWVQLIRF